jgi:anti-sigma factor RsiW
MKPCSKNRKWIAWLALDALDPQQARELGAHLEACERCRRYFEETSKMTWALREAQIRTEAEPSESFHRTVARAIRAQEPRSLWEMAAAAFRATPLKWRAALSALGATAMAIVVLSVLASRFGTGGLPSPAPSPARAVLAPGLNGDLAPTLANYQLAASQSLEGLDDLLTRQANKPRSPVPLYTASTFALANLSD